MAHSGGTCTKQINERGDVFYNYSKPSTITLDQQTAKLDFPSDDSDNNDALDASGDQDEGLSGSLAGLRLADAGTNTHTHRAYHHRERNRSNTRTSANYQWERDNLPIDGTHWPSNEVLTGEGVPFERVSHENNLFDEHIALVALERAYTALDLPITDKLDGQNQHNMVQLAVQFIYRTLPKLNHIREDLENHKSIYDEHTLAEKFYKDHRVALWGPVAGGASDLDHERQARLETFFSALRTQNVTRSEADEIGDQPLEQLVHLRRLTAAASRVVPSETDPVTSLPQLYFALEVQTADMWVNSEFPRAVAQMVFQALSRVREDAHSFPCARPGDVTVESVIERVLGRYGRTLWPNSSARPKDVEDTLHHYVLALVKTTTTSAEVDNGIQMLDGFLELEDGDAEEQSGQAHTEPSGHDGFECPLVRSAESSSCSQQFVLKADVVAHLVKVHEWNQDLADEVVSDL